MAGSVVPEEKAEPNLTPLLDIVFQLITFFMLVINFASDNYDQRINLPDAGSARPVEDAKRVMEDQFVLNIDGEGRLLQGNEVQSLHDAERTIKHQADLVKLNLKVAGVEIDVAASGLPTTIILRADKDATFASILDIIKACQNQGFRKFALKAMIRS